jgi:hypothetical protein
MPTENNKPSLFVRILANETFRKSVAGVIAGALVATISEALWGSSEG